MCDWIDMNIQKPEESTRVLVRFSKPGAYNPCIGRHYYATGYGGYWAYEPDFISPEQPTHWMPLP